MPARQDDVLGGLPDRMMFWRVYPTDPSTGGAARSAARWQRVTMSDLDLTILKNLKKTILGKIVSDENLISYLLVA